MAEEQNIARAPGWAPRLHTSPPPPSSCIVPGPHGPHAARRARAPHLVERVRKAAAVAVGAREPLLRGGARHGAVARGRPPRGALAALAVRKGAEAPLVRHAQRAGVDLDVMCEVRGVIWDGWGDGAGVGG